jgi:hypothetical protein
MLLLLLMRGFRVFKVQGKSIALGIEARFTLRAGSPKRHHHAR